MLSFLVEILLAPIPGHGKWNSFCNFKIWGWLESWLFAWGWGLDALGNINPRPNTLTAQYVLEMGVIHVQSLIR
jgi:hypothetical protein